MDGNNRKYSRTRCKTSPDEWLAVDLGEQYQISHVVVINRQDCCGNMNQYLYILLFENQASNNINLTKTCTLKDLQFRNVQSINQSLLDPILTNVNMVFWWLILKISMYIF